MLDTTIQETFGLATALVILAAFSVAIVNGGKTANVVGAFGRTFNSALRTASKGGK